MSDDRWHVFHHAYGTAENIPAFLTTSELARDEYLAGALCHQGSTCDAGYAAVPHLARLLALGLSDDDWPIVLLIASIEIARLDGLGPSMPEALAGPYLAAISDLPETLSAHIQGAGELFVRSALSAMAACSGRSTMASAILELTPEVLAQFRSNGGFE